MTAKLTTLITQSILFDKPLNKTLLPVLATLTLTACGGSSSGGEGGNNEPAPPPAPKEITTPTVINGMTEVVAARFLQQASLSSTPQEILEVQNLGFDKWLDQQMNMPVLHNSGTNWLIIEYQSYYKPIFDAKIAELTAMMKPTDGANQFASGSPAYVFYMIWKELVSDPDVLRKRIALALTEILVVSSIGLPSSYKSLALGSYWDMLNKQAFGNYYDLLKAVTFHPTMGYYLSSINNRKSNPKTGSNPDENYAREVMQLFSIGLYELNLDGSLKLDANGKPIETYNNDTITNLARIFTGMAADGAQPDSFLLPMKTIQGNHDTGSKILFGKTIDSGEVNSDIESALTILFNHPNVSPFISKQLIMRLITSNPSPAYVMRVAMVFNNNGEGVRGDMKSVIKAILLDTEARFGNVANFGKIREPILSYVQWLRTFTNKQSLTSRWAIGSTENAKVALNQNPFTSMTVFNFFQPNYAPSSADFQNVVSPEMFLVHEDSIVGYTNFFFNLINNKGVKSALDGKIMELLTDYQPYLPFADYPEYLVEKLNTVITGGTLTMATKKIITDALVNSINHKEVDYQIKRIGLAIWLIFISPNYRFQH